MSLERACVNCERCYELASREITRELGTVAFDSDWGEQYGVKDKEELSKNLKFRKKWIYSDDQIYAARNEAMKALEEVKEGGTARSIAGSALIECEKCDYSSPKIVERIEEPTQQ